MVMRILGVVLFLLTGTVTAHLNNQAEKGLLEALMSLSDSSVRPPDGPTKIMVNMFARHIDKIDETNKEFRVQLTFRQQWTDSRLVFNDRGGKVKYITVANKSEVWQPDTFFRNEKDGKLHGMLRPNEYIRIFPNGDVLTSVRVSLTLACPMDLSLFPLDSQSCSLSFASYGGTAEEVTYVWKSADPVQVAKGVSTREFDLLSHTESSCDVTVSTGVYSCLSVGFNFKRNLFPYVHTVYAPTFLLVCFSWLSFWMDHKAAVVRTALTMTTTLIMCITLISIYSKLPTIASVTAIDVWSHVCLSFVFLALLEYVLVNYVAQADARRKEQQRTEMDEEKTAILGDKDAGDCPAKLTGRLPAAWFRCLADADWIDRLARKIFPAAFAVVNVVYWSYYLAQARATSG